MSGTINANEDSRQFVQLPEMMQQNMLSNMRDHLSTLNIILKKLSNNKLDEAAEISESRLGMTSLKSHSDFSYG